MTAVTTAGNTKAVPSAVNHSISMSYPSLVALLPDGQLHRRAFQPEGGADPALTSVWLEKVMLPETDIFSEYVSFGMRQNGKVISEGTVIFSYPKYFRYENPRLSFRLEEDEIIISADAYAKSVEIRNEQEDFILSDNYFDMNAGEKRVKILSGEPQGIRLRSVYDIR